MTAQTPVPGAHLTTMIAVPGAGKTTWVTDRFPPLQRVCLDEYRERVADTESDMSATNEAVAIQGIILTGRLRRGLHTVLDSTNVSPDHRREQLAVAARFSALTIAVVLDVPVEECVARNEARRAAGGRFVPEEVVRRKHRELYVSFPETAVPGFHVTRRVGLDTDRVFTVPGFDIGPYVEAGVPWLR